MKHFILLLLLMGLHFGTQAQRGLPAQESTELFERKGRILLEMGISTGGLFGGSGFSILNPDGGETRTNLNLEGGYFITEDFAIKGQFSLLDDGNPFGSTITTFGIGGKYYVTSKIPIEADVLFLSAFDETATLYNLSAGYAINLAQNIALEPTINYLFGNGSSVEFGLSISLFL